MNLFPNFFYLQKLTLNDRSLSSLLLKNTLFGKDVTFLLYSTKADSTKLAAGDISSSAAIQQENNHLLVPQPLACFPPCSQQEKDNLQGHTPP